MTDERTRAQQDKILLDARGLNKSYGGVQAVREASLTVAVGEVVGLIGPNGAGKTTLVDLLSGTQKGDSGTITLRGRPLSGPPSKRARTGLARTFQHPQLAPDLTVWENVLLGRMHARMGSTLRIIASALRSLVRPVHRADAEAVESVCRDLRVTNTRRNLSDLTLGEQRLVEVARALAQSPDVLLLDEPFAGSDSESETGIRQAITTVTSRGHGVVLVDHNVDIVASLVDRIVLMNQGGVVFEGPPEECLRSPEMRRVYFGTAEGDADSDTDTNTGTAMVRESTREEDS